MAPHSAAAALVARKSSTGGAAAAARIKRTRQCKSRAASEVASFHRSLTRLRVTRRTAAILAGHAAAMGMSTVGQLEVSLTKGWVFRLNGATVCPSEITCVNGRLEE